MNNKHLFYVDFIRIFVVVAGVVLFHVFCGYSGLVAKWYVSVPLGNKAIDFFVVLIDTFAMAVMFFVAGFFTWPSLIKKGGTGFLKERFNKIGIPSLVVLLCLCPTVPYFAQLTRGGTASLISVYLDFFKTFLDFGVRECSFNGVDCHYHIWFAELLLAFSLAIVPLKWLGFGKTPKTEADPVWKITLYLLVFGVTAALLMGYSLTQVAFDGWFRIGPLLVIQVSRLPLYVACFLLGILAQRGSWLESIQTFKKSSPWIISILVLIVINIGLVSVKTGIRPMLQDGISRVMVSYFMLILLLSLSARFLNKPNRIISELSNRSFNIYLLHLPVVVAMQYWLLNSALSNPLKIALIYVATLIVCMPNLTQRLTFNFPASTRTQVAS